MPRPKPNMNELLSKYFDGCQYITPEETNFNCNTLIEVKCNSNIEHTYKISITQIRRGKDPKVCPHCIKETKYKEQGIPKRVIEEYAKINNVTFSPIKKFYNRWKDYITFKCKEDNYEFTVKCLSHWESNKKQFECPLCKKKELGIMTQKELIDKLSTLDNTTISKELKLPPIDIDKLPFNLQNKLKDQSKWTLIEYKNTKTKAKFQCNDCGNIKYTYPHNLFINGMGCKKCHLESKNKKMRENLKSILFESDSYILNDSDKITSTTVLRIKCNKCGHEFKRKYQNYNQEEKIPCPACHKSTKRKSQNEVYEYVKSLEPLAIQEYKINGVELDIYLPSKKLAIEYCGLLWHSTKYIEDSKRHHRKWKFCKDNNIQLLTIFEDEWKDKEEICKSRIKNLMGKIDNKIFARKTEISIIDNKTALRFCETNHIQGRGQSSIAYGLYYKDELISVMTFSKPSVSKSGSNYDYELNRFCSKIDTVVVGGASKLLAQFKKDHEGSKLVTFCDLRWGSGNVYENIGFEYEYTTKENYYYFGKLTDYKRKHRFSFNKGKLLKILNISNSSLTEEQLAKSLGLYRIYDCGHMKFSLTAKEQHV
jgi:hypothetical protein